MRLFVAAVMVVATFIIVALLISWLFPYGAGWAGVCVAITCLYASAFGAWALLGSKTANNARTTQGEVAQRSPLRDNLLYFAVAMAVVTVVIAMVIHDSERGIHRNFKNDWFVGFGSACFALGCAAKAFWISRRNWKGMSRRKAPPRPESRFVSRDPAHLHNTPVRSALSTTVLRLHTESKSDDEGREGRSRR